VGVGSKKGSGNVSRDRDKEKHLTTDKHPKEPSSTSHTGTLSPHALVPEGLIHK
jgi:hypothetical protein